MRNNTTAVTNSIGLLNVGLPYTNVYSIVANGSVLATSFVVAMPSNRSWKKDISMCDDISFVDHMNIYSFSYDDEALLSAGIDPKVLP